MFRRITVKSAMILLLSLIIVLPAFTASGGSISFGPGGGGDTCAESYMFFEADLIADQNDYEGLDTVAFVGTDAAGNILDVDIWNFSTGPITGWDDAVDFGMIEPITACLVTVRLYDIPAYTGDENTMAAYDYVMAYGTLMASDSEDADRYLPQCGALCGASSCDVMWHADGRINAKHGCAPLAAYKDGDGGLAVYRTVAPTYDRGAYLLGVTAEKIAAVKLMGLEPTEQVLIGAAEGVGVWMNGDGRIKVEILGVYGMDFDADILGEAGAVNWSADVLP